MLELRNVSYLVDDSDAGSQKEIIKDISLTIEDGFVAITGPNGGGKSTLAKLIAGIITPTGGQILFNGEDITNLSVTERAKKGVTYAFQQPVRFKGLTVKDLLTIAAGKNVSFNEVCGYLSEVGLCAKDYIDREVNASLSGGELKRIEIAMAIARKTPLTLFDEPEAGIDLWSFQNLIHVFENIHNKSGGSIIIISRIIVLANGEIKDSGTKEEVLPKLLAGAAPSPAIPTDSSLGCPTLLNKMQ